jgi:hypothetical protein
MRRTSLILLTPLLLAGCIKESSSYIINDSDHALTLRAQQDYFWDESVTLTLIASRMPDCQRQFALTKVPIDELSVELFAAGDNVYNLRAGSETWQVETQTCTQTATPDAKALGQPVGTFHLNEEGKLVFEAAADAAAAVAAAAVAAAAAQ